MKKMKILVALAAVVALMVPSVSAFANPPAPTNLQGTTVVQNPTFAVLLPTAPVVTLNPLQIGSTSHEGPGVQPQIRAPWYVVANRSNVPVRVNVAFGPHTAAAPNAATFRETAAAVESGATNRDVFLELQWAHNAAARLLATNPTPTGAATAAALSDLGWEAHATLGRQAIHTPLVTAGTGAGLTATGGHQFYLFLDSQALNTGAITPNNTADLTAGQLAAFTFGGEVNADATWAANSASARVVFTIAGVSPVDVADPENPHKTGFTAVNVAIPNVYTRN